MKLTDQQGGFTIVETLIALAVMGLLFFIAIGSMISYLNQNSFSSGLNDLKEQFQAIINTSSNGQYSTLVGANGYTCSPTNTTPSTPPAITTSASNSQGTNLGCEFIGTALRIGIDAGGSNSALTSISYYPLVINECTNGGVPPCSIPNTETFSDPSGPNNLVTGLAAPGQTTPLGATYGFEDGVTIKDIVEHGTSASTPSINPSATTNAIVFGYSFSNFGLTSSGSSGYTLYPFTPSGSYFNMAEYFNGGTLTSTLLGSLQNVVLCINKGNQYATITIGDASNATSGGLVVSDQMETGGATC